MKILLVDDNDAVRRGLRRMLERKTSMQVVGEAASGVEAVARVEELRPDAVIMDIRMPEMNGIDATRRIKERWPDVRVLAFTSSGDPSSIAAMLKAGASGYLLKGGSVNEIEALLQQHPAG